MRDFALRPVAAETGHCYRTAQTRRKPGAVCGLGQAILIIGIWRVVATASSVEGGIKFVNVLRPRLRKWYAEAQR
jgi:hypothetical protein